MEQELSGNNYKIILSRSPEELEKEIALIDSVTDSVDGLIITPRSANSVDQDYVRFLVRLKARRKIPLLFIEIPVPCVDAVFVGFDQRKAFHEVTRRIIEGGRAGELIFIGLQESVVSVERFLGFKEAVNIAAVGKGRARSVSVDVDLDIGDLAVEKTGGRPSPVVFVASPVLLHRVLAQLREKGCRLPEDVVVVSVVEEDYMDYVGEPIVAIVKPAVALGASAAKTILGMIAGKSCEPVTRMELRVEIPDAVQELLKL